MPVSRESRIDMPSLRRSPGRTTLALIAASMLSGCFNPVSSSLFQPEPLAGKPAAWTARVPARVEARTADGLTLSGWYWAPEQPNGDILLFLPGRAGNRDTAARQAEPFAAGGRGVLVASYRGYGDNPGTPDEQGLYRDGDAFAGVAGRLRGSGRLFLFGDGLGAAVALRLASRADVTATATLGAFDRFANFAPAAVRGFYANAFDNVAAIGRVKTPVLIMHGQKDQVVPYSAAEALKAAAGGTAILAPIAGEAYHSVDFRPIAATVWQAFDEMGRIAGNPRSVAADPAPTTPAATDR